MRPPTPFPPAVTCPVTLLLEPEADRTALRQALEAVGLTVSGSCERTRIVVVSAPLTLLKQTLGIDLLRAHRDGRYDMAAPNGVGPDMLDLRGQVRSVEAPIPAAPMSEQGPSPFPSTTHPTLNGDSKQPSLTELPGLLGRCDTHTASGVRIAVVDTGLRNRFTGQIEQAETLKIPATARRKIHGAWRNNSRQTTLALSPDGALLQPPQSLSVYMEWSGMHPYFGSSTQSTVEVAHDSLDSDADEIGHGTGVVAHLAAVAPGAQITMVKYADRSMLGNFPVAGFCKALSTNPQIILCSWVLSQRSKHLDELLHEANCRGILVVCAVGNGRMDDTIDSIWKPITHATVLSVGGACACTAGPEPSNYTASFQSEIRGAQVPDLLGFSGQIVPPSYPLKSASGIWTPTQPGSLMDQRPVMDRWEVRETRRSGWFQAAGSSFAAAQVAGLAACLLETHPNLCPSQAIAALKQGATNLNVSPPLGLANLASTLETLGDNTPGNTPGDQSC